jgi:hypothetical protein
MAGDLSSTANVVGEDSVSVEMVGKRKALCDAQVEIEGLR